jgi:single-strand DNA-binding protein
MNDTNLVIIKGNLVHDPVVRYLEDGTSVVTVAIGNNRSKKIGENKWTTEGHFFDVTVFGAQAENLGKYRKKGDPVLIEGRLDQLRWEEEGSGRKRQKIVIAAKSVVYLNRSESGVRSSEKESVPPEVREAFPDTKTMGEDEIPF